MCLGRLGAGRVRNYHKTQNMRAANFVFTFFFLYVFFNHRFARCRTYTYVCECIHMRYLRRNLEKNFRAKRRNYSYYANSAPVHARRQCVYNNIHYIYIYVYI